ncbi:NAD(P)-dependent oxidoreductase [Tistrella mobilis]|uniref:NAD-dependent epimerase/dehydratase family protein n=1 Tax=Tistrella mobilis TaxID=171437 RepID=UPI0031F603AC
MREVILVFGGAGFIGTHLLRKLAATTDARLVSADHRQPKSPVDGVEYHVVDVRDLSGFKIEGPIRKIFNFTAVHTTPGHEAHEYYETNVLGATEVTAFARRHGVRNLIFTSSISVYGASEETKSETTPPNPNSAYGASKVLAERIHQAWLDEAEDRRLVIVRPGVIFGKGEGGNFTRLAALLRRGFFVYPGRKDTIKACFYVGDLVDAMLAVDALGERFVRFNGVYPDRYTIEQIIEAFRRKHFPRAKTYLVPRGVLMSIAAVLRPFSAIGLGIHPDRVMKLVRSTDIVPTWLESRGMAQSGRLEAALDAWAEDSGGTFR